MNGSVVVIGEAPWTESFALAGALVLVAEDPAAVRRQWTTIDTGVAMVVLTAAAAAAVTEEHPPHPDLLKVVMPQ